ncbi:MAG: hypothetical protein WD844_06125 [Thermoleophilaceae bacterium]
MNEAHFNEIERALLHISDARRRTARAAKALSRDGAEPHLVAALEEADQQMEALGRRLTQRTYFAVPEADDQQDRMAV